jgi:hypothetical protein
MHVPCMKAIGFDVQGQSGNAKQSFVAPGYYYAAVSAKQLAQPSVGHLKPVFTCFCFTLLLQREYRFNPTSDSMQFALPYRSL